MTLSRLKIAVYAISKNEEAFALRWMNSMQEADIVIVADTGSTDHTVSILRTAGAVVHDIRVDPWRFDAARNEALHLVPDDVDICVCTDLDEEFEDGWRMKLEQAWEANTTRLMYRFNYSDTTDGSSEKWYWKEKIHSRHDYHWTRPVHEILEYIGEGSEHINWAGDIRMNHKPDPHKSRSQYLALLELSVHEYPEDDRNMHYLGREYLFYQQWGDCITTLLRHLAMPQATWADERSASMRFISRAFLAQGEVTEAVSWLYKAMAETPYLREPYTEMAQLAYRERNWPAVHHMVLEALRIHNRPDNYLQEPFCWDATLYDLGALSSYELGMLSQAMDFAKKATDIAPGDSRLRSNYEIIRSALAANPHLVLPGE